MSVKVNTCRDWIKQQRIFSSLCFSIGAWQFWLAWMEIQKRGKIAQKHFQKKSNQLRFCHFAWVLWSLGWLLDWSVGRFRSTWFDWLIDSSILISFSVFEFFFQSRLLFAFFSSPVTWQYANGLPISPNGKLSSQVWALLIYRYSGALLLFFFCGFLSKHNVLLSHDVLLPHVVLLSHVVLLLYDDPLTHDDSLNTFEWTQLSIEDRVHLLIASSLFLFLAVAQRLSHVAQEDAVKPVIRQILEQRRPGNEENHHQQSESSSGLKKTDNKKSGAQSRKKSPIRGGRSVSCSSSHLMTFLFPFFYTTPIPHSFHAHSTFHRVFDHFQARHVPSDRLAYAEWQTGLCRVVEWHMPSGRVAYAEW